MTAVTDKAAEAASPCTLSLAGAAAWAMCNDASNTALRHPLPAIDVLWLARLALDGPQLRGSLAAWCWPKASPARGLNNLRQRLHRTRRLLGPVLLHDGDFLGLAPHVRVLVDALPGPELAFTTALSPDISPDTSPATPRVPSRAAFLSDLDALVVGRPLLKPWLEDARSRWCAQQLRRWAAEAEGHERSGDPPAALRLAEAATQLAPAEADGWFTRLRLLCDGGRFVEARAVWRLARRWVGPLSELQPAWLDLQHRIDAGANPRPARYRGLPEFADQPPAAPPSIGLSAAARSLLRFAALAGDAHSLLRAATALGWALLELADPLAELQACGWLDGDGNMASMAHASSALGGFPAALRRPFHAALAQLLQQEGAGPELAAQHWQKAERWAEAAAAWGEAEAAADRDNRRYAALALNDELAAAWLAGGRADEAWRAALRAMQRAHTLEPAAELAKRCAALEPRVSTPSARRALDLHRCRLALAQNDLRTTETTAQQVLDSAVADGDFAAELAATGWMAVALACSGRGPAARALLDRYPSTEAAAQGVGPGAPENRAGSHQQALLRARLDFLGCQGWVLHTEGRYVDAMLPLQLAADLAERLGDAGDLAEQLVNLALCANSAGNRPVELAAAERVVALWQRLGEPDCLAADTARVLLATVYMGSGRYRESLALLLTVLPRLDQPASAGWHWIATHRLANLWIRLGQPARARHALPALTEAAGAGVRIARALVLARLEPATLTGRAAALRMLRAAWDDHAALITVQERHSLLLGLAALEPDDEAIARCTALLEEADAAATLHGNAGLAAVARAAALRRSERHASRGDYRAAMADLERLGAEWHGNPASAAGAPPVHGIEDIEVCRIVAEVAGAASTALASKTGHGPDALHALTQAQAALASGLATARRIATDLTPELRGAFEHRHPSVAALKRLAAGSRWLNSRQAR